MWLLFAFVSLLVVVAHGVYFARRLTRALADVAPIPAVALRWARIGLIAITASLPVTILLYAAYLVVADPDGNARPGAVYDYLITYPFWFLAIWSFQCTLLVVPVDLVHLAVRACGAARGKAWQRRKNLMVTAVYVACLVSVTVGFVRGSSELQVRRFEYASASVPPDLDGYRIALVADMQADQFTDGERLDQLVDAVNALEPDLVVIAGDMVTRGPDYVDAVAAHAGRLRARDGVFAAVGDHDNWVFRGKGSRKRSVAAIVAALARHGISMADDHVETIAVGDATLGLILATNNYVRRIDRDATRQLVSRVASTDMQVMVAHQTGEHLVADARDGGVDLFLGGHTHGGQIRFWTPLGDLYVIQFETPWVTGAYQSGDMMIVITSGLGVSVAPYRYRAPATVELVELRRQ